MMSHPCCSWYDRTLPFVLVHVADWLLIHHLQGQKRKKLEDEQKHTLRVDVPEDQVFVD